MYITTNDVRNSDQELLSELVCDMIDIIQEDIFLIEQIPYMERTFELDLHYRNIQNVVNRSRSLFKILTPTK